MTLRTLNYGNYGIFLIMGNAGFCPSTATKVPTEPSNSKARDFRRWTPFRLGRGGGPDCSGYIKGGRIIVILIVILITMTVIIIFISIFIVVFLFCETGVHLLLPLSPQSVLLFTADRANLLPVSYYSHSLRGSPPVLRCMHSVI